MKQAFHQQGDILFIAIKSLPKGLKKRNNPILFYGESTGHKHQVVTNEVDLSDILYEDESGNLFIRNSEPVTIRHNTHHDIILEPNTWKVNRVLEQNHPEDEARHVTD